MAEGNFRWNPATKRAIVQVPFGIACYTGYVADGKFHGVHQGTVGDGEHAMDWLQGNDDVPLLKLYTNEEVERAAG